MAITNFSLCSICEWKILQGPSNCHSQQFFLTWTQYFGNIAANKLGSSVNLVNVDKFPCLNTLGISLACIDFAPYGLNPPHTHPRGTELLVVIEGTLSWICHIQPKQTLHQSSKQGRCLCIPNWSHSLPIQHRGDQCFGLF